MPKNIDILFSFDQEKGEARQPHAGLRAKLIIPDPELIGKITTFRGLLKTSRIVIDIIC